MLFCAGKYPIVGPESSVAGGPGAIIEGIILFVIAASLLHWPLPGPTPKQELNNTVASGGS